jgi:hypothetical protein
MAAHDSAPKPARIIRPNSIPQELFLSSSADVAVYGGSAGSGKSFALLLDDLRNVANPDFGSVIFRRLTPQIKNEGGLWDEAGKIYPLAGGEPRVGDLSWRWPSGAKVSFRHLQHEATKYAWQGSQIPKIGLDELTHFSESQFWYMLSRNRSDCGVIPYVRATTNADAGSWVKRLLAPWVDRKYPDKAASGEIRYLVRKDGKYHWSRSRAELAARFPKIIAKSITFIRASIHDNVDLLRDNPEYLGNLQAQSPVDQARLLYGDWDIVNEGLVYPDFGSGVIEVEDWPGFAGSATHPADPRPAMFGNRGGIDYGFRNPFGAILAADRDGVLWCQWERHATRATLTDHSLAMPRGSIRWYADPAGADQTAELRAAGHDVVPAGHVRQGNEPEGPLKAGIAMVTERLRQGTLKIRGDLGHLIDEAGKYHYDGQTEIPVDADNHLLAALRYLVVQIDRGKAVADGPPPETEEHKRAVAAAEEAAKAARRAKHRSIDNDLFFH